MGGVDQAGGGDDGRAVLVGTRSVAASERIGALLAAAGAAPDAPTGQPVPGVPPRPAPPL